MRTMRVHAHIQHAQRITHIHIQRAHIYNAHMHTTNIHINVIIHMQTHIRTHTHTHTHTHTDRQTDRQTDTWNAYLQRTHINCTRINYTCTHQSSGQWTQPRWHSMCGSWKPTTHRCKRTMHTSGWVRRYLLTSVCPIYPRRMLRV